MAVERAFKICVWDEVVWHSSSLSRIINCGQERRIGESVSSVATAFNGLMMSAQICASIEHEKRARSSSSASST